MEKRPRILARIDIFCSFFSIFLIIMIFLNCILFECQ
jgi:hypothetical protein